MAQTAETASALEGFPAAPYDHLDEFNFLRGPMPRGSLVHSHGGGEFAAGVEGDTDDCTDSSGPISWQILSSNPRVDIDVIDDIRFVSEHEAVAILAKGADGPTSDNAGNTASVITGDHEYGLVFDLSIGTAIHAEVFREEPRSNGHDFVRISESLGSVI